MNILASLLATWIEEPVKDMQVDRIPFTLNCFVVIARIEPGVRGRRHSVLHLDGTYSTLSSTMIDDANIVYTGSKYIRLELVDTVAYVLDYTQCRWALGLKSSDLFEGQVQTTKVSFASSQYESFLYSTSIGVRITVLVSCLHVQNDSGASREGAQGITYTEVQEYRQE